MVFVEGEQGKFVRQPNVWRRNQTQSVESVVPLKRIIYGRRVRFVLVAGGSNAGCWSGIFYCPECVSLRGNECGGE